MPGVLGYIRYGSGDTKMTVGDLIAKKDYDLIEWRVTDVYGTFDGDMLFGFCKSKDGELISIDGDSYYKDEEVLSYEEWSTNDVPNGLTVVTEVEFV